MNKLFIVFMMIGLMLNNSTFNSKTIENEDINIIENKKITNDSFYDNNINSSYEALLELQSEETYLSQNYSSIYFNNLKNNFGNNVYGTCTYTALGMLLSFYDTYWDDSFIPNQYETNSVLNSSNVALPINQDSPGILFESFDLIGNSTLEEYLDIANQYSNSYFQLKLIDMAIKYFNEFKKEDYYSNYLGLTYNELISFTSYYLYDYLNKTSSEVEITSNTLENLEVREFTIEKIKQGIPVLLRMGVYNQTYGHAMIAYDYDEKNDEIYVHTGWRDEENNTSLTHIAITDLDYNHYWDAIALLKKTSHSHTNNYKYTDANGNIYTKCSCAYSFPQNILITSGNYRDTVPTFKWDSIINEDWFAGQNLSFQFSILNSNRQAIITKNNVTTSEYTLSKSNWNTVLNYDGKTYYVYIQIESADEFYWDDYQTSQVFSKPLDYDEIPFICPNEYGFADTYPSDTSTSSLFTKHNVRGFTFETRRYRTGFIHNEYIVMSPIRENINEAWIEYKFSTPISRIDIQLSHWRPYSNECLDSSTGTAVVQQYISNQWITNLDLLSDSTALPTERANIKIYTINFAVPTTQFRIYSHSFTVNTNDSNRGRICIGNIAFYPQEQYLKPTDKSSSISNSKQISFEGYYLEGFQYANDVDYFKYTAQNTNYIQFNIQSMWTSYNLCNISVYKSDDLTTPILSYNNTLSILGDDISSVPEIYTEQGDVYYFKIEKIEKTPITTEILIPSYYARVLSANYADCDSEQFVSKGYVSQLQYAYNGSNNIYVYFDGSTNEVVNSSHGYTYKQIVLEAMQIWNEVGIMQWVEVSDQSLADTVVECVYDSTATFTGVYTSFFSNNVVNSGKLSLNKYYQQNYSYARTLKTCVHELGHGLGLGHIDYDGSNNVMYSYSAEYKYQLGKGDIAAYRYLWG